MDLVLVIDICAYVIIRLSSVILLLTVLFYLLPFLVWCSCLIAFDSILNACINLYGFAFSTSSQQSIMSLYCTCWFLFICFDVFMCMCHFVLSKCSRVVLWNRVNRCLCWKVF